jgi:hypothetical protein
MTHKTKSRAFTSARGAVLLLGLVSVACEAETQNPEGGRPSGASSNEVANPGAASASQGELVAQKSFRDGTETLSLSDLGAGSFSAKWAGNPKGGRSALAQAFMGLKLSEIWELVAAPGQAPAPALAALMTAHPARPDTLATLESQLAAPAQARGATASTELDVLATAAVTATNYCDNGGFFNDFGVNAENNGGWLYQAPIKSAPSQSPAVMQYGTLANTVAISYSGFGLAATAVCPTNDGGFFNGSNVPAGTGVGIKVWSNENCGFDLTCCVLTGCNSCTIAGANFTWTWVDFCPNANSFCTDRNITEVVTYQQFLHSGCAQ